MWWCLWGETLGLDDTQLATLFQRTFESKTLDNFQKSLVWQCYRGALPIWDKLTRHGIPGSSNCPRCWWDKETALHAIVQCPKVTDVWVYAEQLLSNTGRVQLLSESIVKIDSPGFLKNCFLIEEAIAREVIWKARMKGLRSDIFISSPDLVNLFIFHLKRKVGLERRCLCVKMF